jgi:hypothetical protein
MARKTVSLNVCLQRSIGVTVDSGDGDRFARLFTETWSRLPPDTQAGICTHWAKEEDQEVRIELSNWLRKSLNRDAQVALLGYELMFDAAEVDRMPDPVVKALIAHELAHVFQYATGRNLKEDLESDAEDLVCEWSLDLESAAYFQWRAKRELGLLNRE